MPRLIAVKTHILVTILDRVGTDYGTALSTAVARFVAFVAYEFLCLFLFIGLGFLTIVGKMTRLATVVTLICRRDTVSMFVGAVGGNMSRLIALIAHEICLFRYSRILVNGS